jgi:hypothetical protein
LKERGPKHKNQDQIVWVLHGGKTGMQFIKRTGALEKKLPAAAFVDRYAAV